VLAGCAPHGVTAQGREIERLYNFFLAAAAVVWVVVTGLMLWSIVRYRRRGDELPPQIHGSNKLELTWTILPTILVLVLFWATVQTQDRVTGPAGDPDPVQVHVRAFQWQWQFTYLRPGGGQPDVQVIGTIERIPELVVPAGETVRIRLDSADVTHSFFVPRALFKRMAVPGRSTEFDMTFDRPGLYPGNCTQYCGLRHAQMVFNVRVVAREQYQQWLTRQRATGGAGT
jgi:cytochrome c oxidase subunit 2